MKILYETKQKHTRKTTNVPKKPVNRSDVNKARFSLEPVTAAIAMAVPTSQVTEMPTIGCPSILSSITIVHVNLVC